MWGLGFPTLRSVSYFFSFSLIPKWDIYATYLLMSGLVIPLILKSDWSVLLGALAVFCAENCFYIYVNVFGNLNGCYGWYTGNPLNPDGVWGYGWTNPMGMVGYFVHVMRFYILVYLVVWFVCEFKRLKTIINS
jgi:hypothetical protein